MPNTLFGRLLIASLLVLGLFFGSLGYVSNELFQQNQNHTKKEQLKLQNYVLLTSAKIRDQGIIIEDELRESRFEDFESGLYGFIANQKGEILWRTYSSHTLEIDPKLLVSSHPTIGGAQFFVDPKYFRYQYTVLWEVRDDNPEFITFTVMEDRGPSLENAHTFRNRLLLWLSTIAFVLLVILLLLLRWGTRPLRKLATKLKQVESGERDQLEGDYPRELQRLIRNLNELLLTEKRQRERYHYTLADLAHSLKTPLAVIQAELESSEKNVDIISDQIARMDEIIKHQLQRAVVAAPHQLGDKTGVLETAERLTNALAKVYADRKIKFSLEIKPDIYFTGDKRDLTEVLGNLIDNACKHCTEAVMVSAERSGDALVIGVHDDGFGITEEYRAQLMNRGLRADTRHTGQGIGLDVARDIVNSYRGELTISDSPLGGALFLVRFPT